MTKAERRMFGRLRLPGSTESAIEAALAGWARLNGRQRAGLTGRNHRW